MREQPERTGPEALRPSLRDDESGIALLYVTIAPAIIGLASLAVGAVRLLALNSSFASKAAAQDLRMSGSS